MSIDNRIKSKNVRDLIVKGKIKVGDRIKLVGFREHPEFICSVEEGKTVVAISPSGDIDSPDEIHWRHYEADSDQIYGEIHRPGSNEYDKLLKRLNEIKGDYKCQSKGKISAIKAVWAEQLYDLVHSKKVNIGDNYLLIDEDAWQMVYNVGEYFADTFVHTEGGIKSEDSLRESRYFGERRCREGLGSHRRGSKDYHALLVGNNRLDSEIEEELAKRH